MHATSTVRAWIICVGIAATEVAMAAPPANVTAQYQLATQLDASGEYEKALVSVDEGLALAPKDLPLLGLKGAVLLKLHDYTGALAAYRAYLAAGATGANRRDAEKIVSSLRDVQSTFLEISLANGPAAVYLDLKTQGVFCTAAPSCRKPVLPGQYKVIAERDGFERWNDSVTVQAGQRSEERRVGKECRLTCRSRWSPYH